MTNLNLKRFSKFMLTYIKAQHRMEEHTETAEAAILQNLLQAEVFEKKTNCFVTTCN